MSRYLVLVIPNWAATLLSLAGLALAVRAWWLARRNSRILARAEEIIRRADEEGPCS